MKSLNIFECCCSFADSPFWWKGGNVNTVRCQTTARWCAHKQYGHVTIVTLALASSTALAFEGRVSLKSRCLIHPVHISDSWRDQWIFTGISVAWLLPRQLHLCRRFMGLSQPSSSLWEVKLVAPFARNGGKGCRSPSSWCSPFPHMLLFCETVTAAMLIISTATHSSL